MTSPLQIMCKNDAPFDLGQLFIHRACAIINGLRNAGVKDSTKMLPNW